MGKMMYDSKAHAETLRIRRNAIRKQAKHLDKCILDLHGAISLLMTRPDSVLQWQADQTIGIVQESLSVLRHLVNTYNYPDEKNA
jgi:hypothetical protein